MAPLKILICGNSIAGPTLASFLLLTGTPAAEKPHITLLERAPSLRTNGQNVDIRASGKTIIQKLGLETAVKAATTGEEGVQWVDTNGKVFAAIPAGESEKQHSPTSDIEIMRGKLGRILHQCSERISDQVSRDGGKGIEYVFGDYVSEIVQNDDEKVVVRFANSGEQRTYDLMVGADGLQSKTRRLVFGQEGEESRVKNLGLYFGYFSMVRSPTDTLWRQWYHAPGRKGIMLRPDTSSKPAKTTAGIHVMGDDPRLREVAEKHAPGEGYEKTKALMTEYFKDIGWQSERVLSEMQKSHDFYYDMVAQVKMEKYSKGRVVLLGDAAHCASPISGMGTTLALMGAYHLAGAISQNPDNLAAAFEQYEAAVRPTATKAQDSVPGRMFIFSADTAWDLWKLETFASVLSRLKPIAGLLFYFLGPSADKGELPDYGFRRLDEYEGSTV